MATVTNKAEVSSVKGKEKRKIESGKKKAVLCREFGLVNPTIQKIWGKKKRHGKPERSDGNEARVK
jgi:hypothetical protein